MTSAPLGESTESLPAPGLQTRLTQAALFLNAALHGIASVGMAAGLGPHTADEPHMGRRAGAAGIAGAFMLAFVGKRLRREPLLIVMPLVFVACNLATTLYEVVTTRDPSALPPLLPEATFFVVYALFVGALARRRGRRG
jgi:hypothetical protein